MSSRVSRDGKRARKGTPLGDRLMMHVDTESRPGCWVWTAALDVNGYGRISVDHKLRYAHRIAYALFVGPVPTGMQLDHLCRNRDCCNPSHLEAVSARTNVRRGVSPGARALRRSHCLYGHDYAIFGFQNAGRRRCSECHRVYAALWRGLSAAEIARRKAAGERVVDLAAHFAAERSRQDVAA